MLREAERTLWMEGLHYLKLVLHSKYFCEGHFSSLLVKKLLSLRPVHWKCKSVAGWSLLQGNVASSYIHPMTEKNTTRQPPPPTCIGWIHVIFSWVGQKWMQECTKWSITYSKINLKHGSASWWYYNRVILKVTLSFFRPTFRLTFAISCWVLSRADLLSNQPDIQNPLEFCAYEGEEEEEEKG